MFAVAAFIEWSLREAIDALPEKPETGNHMTVEMQKSAVISPCGRYRYRLERNWSGNLDAPYVCYIGLNPSTADDKIDDQTVRKWTGFTTRLGFERFVVVNLYAFRATKPADLFKAKDRIGDANHEAIIGASTSAAVVVACWGTHGIRYFRGAYMVVEMRRRKIPAMCWGKCDNGEPVHPLMLPYETELTDL